MSDILIGAFIISIFIVGNTINQDNTVKLAAVVGGGAIIGIALNHWLPTIDLPQSLIPEAAEIWMLTGVLVYCVTIGLWLRKKLGGWTITTGATFFVVSTVLYGGAALLLF